MANKSVVLWVSTSPLLIYLNFVLAKLKLGLLSCEGRWKEYQMDNKWIFDDCSYFNTIFENSISPTYHPSFLCCA
ncbi:hypothetical protein BTHERMOSOX_169 [Bathymodiolus thermophilus thioautotrophic gill symbiont]|uniref:Uncharacterized protein n=1 Tax=Bathymodiolus thermophilus thioautotrophic gill symbiont TaxID=2360 RepID=A0A8H9CGI6_9GAMM|nr:hypothetical protein [Bathymodiolus thermophilus thioautotrophic gill symbiont]CAB5504535.1 hypothetical protein THERMOS_1976 [Bathymodiolus thermophilus thioautotrophic gill symbiont]SGZ78803.1 hypothetical protein BTHERMOSOX_169 [Bathymodiolus thermophilus thioautotrophic gill symbiont]